MGSIIAAIAGVIRVIIGAIIGNIIGVIALLELLEHWSKKKCYWSQKSGPRCDQQPSSTKAPGKIHHHNGIEYCRSER